MAVQDKITEIIVEQLGVKPEEVVPEASFVDDLASIGISFLRADRRRMFLGRIQSADS